MHPEPSIPRRSPSRPWLRAPGTATLLVGVAAAAFGLGRRWAPADAESTPPQSPGAVALRLSPADVAAQVSRAFQAASARAAESVVQVQASRRRGRRFSVAQEGSGVIVDPSGIVVTNHHVVADTERFAVIFTDGSKREADLIGSDEAIDLAVLRIRGDEAYEVLELREEQPPVGELVLAIGNPLSLGHTVTLGVVNGLGRARLDIADYENYIQTDAAVNPGNSGGPLIDLRGRVVGINVAVGLESNGDEGLAFAIPAGMVRRVVDQIVEHGRLRRAYLGINTYWEQKFYDPTAPDRDLGYGGLSRVKVRQVYDDTPADRAGLRAGDIILSIAGKALHHNPSFRNALIEASPGETVEIVVWRGGRRVTTSARLRER